MERLSRTPLFAGLSGEQLKLIDRRMTRLSWSKGQFIHTAGEPARHLFLLAGGRVRTLQPAPNGQQIVADLLIPTDLFGRIRTGDQAAYTETAEAITTVCTLQISDEDFLQVLSDHPEVGLRLLADTSERLSHARADVLRQSTTSVAKRVAAILLRLTSKFDWDQTAGAAPVHLPLTRTDLAGMAGSTPESVSRVMSRWQTEGIVESGRGWTVVLDSHRLAAVHD